jgi:hypothetical protein
MTNWKNCESIIAREGGCEIRERQSDGSLGAPVFRATAPIVLVDRAQRKMPLTPEEFEAKFGPSVKFAFQYKNVYRAMGPQFVKTNWWFESHIINASAADQPPGGTGVGFPLSVSIMLPDSFAQQFADDWLSYVAGFLPAWGYPLYDPTAQAQTGPSVANFPRVTAQVRASKLVNQAAAFKFAKCGYLQTPQYGPSKLIHVFCPGLQ